MRKENIIKAAIRNNMDSGRIWQFVEFFSRRFPDESNSITSYVDEWAGRFKKGDTEMFMDTESLKIWKEVKEELITEEE